MVDPTLLQDAAALNRVVGDLVRIYQFRDRDRICCHDISVTQCYALETIVERGPLRANAVAARLMLDKSTTSRVLDSLERKGYVRRMADPDDARAQQLEATAAGRTLHDRIVADLVDQQRAAIADLAPETRAAAIDVIGRLAKLAETRFRAGVSTGPACGAIPVDPAA